MIKQVKITRFPLRPTKIINKGHYNTHVQVKNNTESKIAQFSSCKIMHHMPTASFV
jgi:hypothetical protein